jgi:hypothetical protein
MDEPIENEYFNWLCVRVLERNGRMYYDLLGILHTTEFIWVVPQDSHRAADGIELRNDFLRESYRRNDPNWYAEPCSVLEMLIAFAKRASFQTGRPTRWWFWEMMSNLQLDQFRLLRDEDVRIIKDILHRFMCRDYDSHGYGGLFPITITQNDQRDIEIWYQFSEYTLNNGLV